MSMGECIITQREKHSYLMGFCLAKGNACVLGDLAVNTEPLFSGDKGNQPNPGWSWINSPANYAELESRAFSLLSNTQKLASRV